MGLMTTLRTRMTVVLWALLVLFLLSMSIGGLVGGANIIDQLVGRVDPTRVIARINDQDISCLLYTSPSPRDATLSRMPSSA